MERAPGDGHSLAKMTVVESSGQIETCRWEIFFPPPIYKKKFPISYLEDFSVLAQAQADFKGLLRVTVRLEAGCKNWQLEQEGSWKKECSN